MMMITNKLLKWLLVLFICVLSTVLAQLDELERRQEYQKRGYSFPPKKMAPDTQGWRKLNERRFNQVEHIKDVHDRYQGWVIAAISAYVQQNFTNDGWYVKNANSSHGRDLYYSTQHHINTCIPGA